MSIRKLYLLLAAFALVLGSTACQTAQRQATLLPPGASSPPGLSATPAPAHQPAASIAPVAAPTQNELKPDQVAELIAQVDKEYQIGEDNYKAGHLEAAKENFDRAFNLLLGSSLDVRSDDRLQQEFDRVLDGVNGLELQALQEGDGFTSKSRSRRRSTKPTRSRSRLTQMSKRRPRPRSRPPIRICL